MKPGSNSAASLHALFSRIRSLADRSGRSAQNAFFLEGLRSFIQAHDAGFHFQAIIYSPILLKGDLADMLARRLHIAGVPRVKVTPEQFRAVSRGARASGIGAIVRQRWATLDGPRAGAGGLCHLVVEQIRCPGNLGTILRTAEATGVGSVIFVGHASDPYDPACVRASMGGLFHLPLVRATHEQLAAWTNVHHVRLAGLSPNAAHHWTELPRSSASAPLAIVLGEERRGISPRLQQLCTSEVKLPMVGRADSLNVSIAAGIMLYELIRRLIRSPRMEHQKDFLR
ncbi:MAG TPA: RNA methyltransferase [Phycisphaerae bacterium]|nr:RNA methyltransferase [Phycisphaerae bacterium]